MATPTIDELRAVAKKTFERKTREKIDPVVALVLERLTKYVNSGNFEGNEDGKYVVILYWKNVCQALNARERKIAVNEIIDKTKNTEGLGVSITDVTSCQCDPEDTPCLEHEGSHWCIRF